MDDFGRIVYLDVEKTGSSFISNFLQENLTCQRVKKVKHGRIGRNFKEGSFYFISVRNPLSQYLSLYHYGCEGKGEIYDSIKKSGYSQLYQPNKESFQHWLQFVLCAKNAANLGPDYRAVDTELMGLQTFRFLALSFQNALKKLKAVHDYPTLCGLYEKRIHSQVVRNESLRVDMKNLVDTHLSSFVDTESAKRYLEKSPPINRSPKLDFDIESIDEETMSLVRRKERFLLEQFYPEAL
jgi:hypothetical protein|tara:strand:- start:3 stop:719 length:717 start_codon:yes stop_codon:yes gene_type:complete